MNIEVRGSKKIITKGKQLKRKGREVNETVLTPACLAVLWEGSVRWKGAAHVQNLLERERN